MTKVNQLLRKRIKQYKWHHTAVISHKSKYIKDVCINYNFNKFKIMGLDISGYEKYLFRAKYLDLKAIDMIVIII